MHAPPIPPSPGYPEYLHVMAGTAVAELAAGILGELVRLAEAVIAEVFEGESVDWEELWIQLDGAVLADGRKLNIDAPDSPVQRTVRRLVEARA